MGWIGVDLDGTLAFYDGWKGEAHVGEPVPKMVERVQAWLGAGHTVKIVTARVAPGAVNTDGTARNLDMTRKIIEQWCERHIGQVLPITHEKDFGMLELWDDRVVQVYPNTGERADGLDKEYPREFDAMCRELASLAQRRWHAQIAEGYTEEDRFYELVTMMLETFKEAIAS